MAQLKKFEIETLNEMSSRILSQKNEASRSDETLSDDAITIIDWKVCTRNAVDEYISALITQMIDEKESHKSNRMCNSELLTNRTHLLHAISSEDADRDFIDDSVVVVFDGLLAFNRRHPKYNEELAKQVSIVTCVDQFLLFCSIMRYMKNNTFNSNLKLIVVYCNDLFVDKILKLLKNIVFHRVVVITYGYSNSALNKDRFRLIKVEI